MKPVKIILTALLLLFCLYLIYLNKKLYYRPVISKQGNEELIKQFYYLRSQMANGADIKMQALFPEGYMFMNALYGISCAELAMNTSGKVSEDACLESYRCYKRMDTESARSIFEKDLLLPYGAYYQGWSTFQMGKLIEVGGKVSLDTALIAAYQLRCNTIAKSMGYAQVPYMESYDGYSWPADMVVCVAALSLHDRLFTPQYQAIILKWVTGAREHLDTLGMMPHRVDAFDNYPLEGAKGNSMGLMLCFLKQIDSAFYYEQYKLYKSNFLDSRFSLPGIREYPKGIEGEGDVDSGPVLLGIGGAASVVGVRVFAAERDLPVAIALRNSIDAFGMPMQGPSSKKYLFGVLPMADVFIFWVNSTEQTNEAELVCDTNWRVMFQFYTSTVLLLIIALIWFVWLKR